MSNRLTVVLVWSPAAQTGLLLQGSLVVRMTPSWTTEVRSLSYLQDLSVLDHTLELRRC